MEGNYIYILNMHLRTHRTHHTHIQSQAYIYMYTKYQSTIMAILSQTLCIFHFKSTVFKHLLHLATITLSHANHWF